MERMKVADTTNKKVNNKELIPLELYLKRFREADPEEMAYRTQTPYDGEKNCFTVRYLYQDYQLTWPEAEVSPAGDQADEKSFLPLVSMITPKIQVLRYLLECAQVPASGKFLSFREVPEAEIYYQQYTGRCVTRLAFSYASKLPVFRGKMEKLGARRLTGQAGIPSADEVYEAEIFPGYFVRFLLWGPDEDFPPSAQILFSDNFPVSFHTEDLVVVAEQVLNVLKHI